MKGCEDYEVEIEMRLHGALASAVELDAHLATCASCRAFEELAKRTEKTMSSVAMAEAQTIDWEQMKTTLKSRVTRDALRRTGVIAAIAVAELVAMTTFEPNAKHLSTIMPSNVLLMVGVVVIALVAAMSRRWRMREYETTREDLSFFHRSYLEGRLWRTTALALFAIPFGMSYWVVRLPRAHVPPMEWAGASLMALIFIGIGVWSVTVVRPRLQRELDAFKRRP